MATMFRLYWGRISEYEVNKTSDKSVWYMMKKYRSDEMFENRELLETNEHKWFKEKQSAIDAHISELQKKLSSAEYQFKSAQEDLRIASKKYYG